MTGARLHHTGLNVVDIEISTTFYESIGFTRAMPAPLEIKEAQWAATVLGVAEPHLKVMFLELQGAQLELIEFVAPPGSGSPSLAVSDPGRGHIAIAVDDVVAEYDRLSAIGVGFISKPIHVEDGDFAGVTAVYGVDPDGNSFELISGL